MTEKVTIMVLKVDLQCSCCYKKVKKLLCKFPQIRDQVYDEKANTVTITVVCCSPEKIRDKLRCKGGKTIQSIVIKEPTKPKEPEKPKAVEKPKEVEKPKVVEKPKEVEKPKAVEKPKEVEKPKVIDKPKEVEKPKAVEKPKDVEKPQPVPIPIVPQAPVAPQLVPVSFCEPVHGYPHMPMYPGSCCGPCSEGYSGGPCYHGYGGRPIPPPPRPCYGEYGYEYGYRYGYGNRGNRSWCVSGDYFSEENSQGCLIM